MSSGTPQGIAVTQTYMPTGGGNLHTDIHVSDAENSDVSTF